MIRWLFQSLLRLLVRIWKDRFKIFWWLKTHWMATLIFLSFLLVSMQKKTEVSFGLIQPHYNFWDFYRDWSAFTLPGLFYQTATTRWVEENPVMNTSLLTENREGPSAVEKPNSFSNLDFREVPGETKARREARLRKRKKRLAYVNRYADIARMEMEKYGIPASITLAQGLLESNAGESTLAKKNNNHFGIKCFSRRCYKGHCSNFNDDHHKDFFRIYKSPWESYRAHSKFLLKDRYKHLLELERSDYKQWAHGLKEAGYATDPKYAYKLIDLIEDLQLDRYDR